VNKDLSKLFAAATAARSHAYAPYSRYHVGAAIRLQDSGLIFGGCNVENASYGGTLCAERTAIVRAVAEQGPGIRVAELLLITETPAPPCGMCLQVMSEFCDGGCPVHLATPAGVHRTVTLNDLLPIRFDSQNLDTP